MLERLITLCECTRGGDPWPQTFHWSSVCIMGSTARYVGGFCCEATSPLLTGNWDSSKERAKGEERWRNSNAAAAAIAAGGGPDLPNTWRQQYGLSKNDSCTEFAVTLQQPQQGAPTLLTLRVERTAGFAQQSERQNAMQQQILQQASSSHETVGTRGRDSGNFGDLGSESWKSLLCKDTLQAQRQRQWQWHQQLLGGAEHRLEQQKPHEPRLLVGSCPAVQEDVEATCFEQPPGSQRNAVSSAATEATGGTSSVLLHSAAGAFRQGSSGGYAAAKTRLHCAAGSSVMCGPAAADCSGSPLDVARAQPSGTTTTARMLIGAAAGAGGRLEGKITARSGAPYASGFLRSESFERFLESPYPDDSSGFSGRSTHCSACKSSLRVAGGDSVPFSDVVVGDAAALRAGDLIDRQEIENGMVVPQPINKLSEEGTQVQLHKHQQPPDQDEGQKKHHRPDQQDQLALSKGSRQEEIPPEQTQSRQECSVERESAPFWGPPELLKETQLVSQVRVLQRDPTTGAAQERIVQVLLIHRNPEIFYIPDLLTDEECDHLIAICRGRWERSKTSTGYATAEPHEYSSMNSANRTSSSVPLAVGETTGVENVERLAAAFADMNVQHLEPLIIVRYEPGQCFKAHHDGGFRPKTLLLYLNDVEEGGETSFENLGFCISPAKRAGVLWTNAYPGTNIIDPRLLHSGLPPTKGIKYVVNCFFNKDPVRLGATQRVDVSPAVTPRVRQYSWTR